MTGILPLASTGSDHAVTGDRASLAVTRALQEKRKEATAMVRLIEATTRTDKGQHVDYRA
jgi:hypothetical protein